MQVELRVENLRALGDVLAKLSGPQAQAAYAKAINDTAFHVRAAMQQEMRKVFDRPTDYILRSPFVRKATPTKLSASIEPTYMGGKGVDPQKILQAQDIGGRRRDKRSEVALRRAGILPPGWQTAIPAAPFPGSDDGRGNVRGPFLVQLLAYFEAFGEQGYKANMNQKGRDRLRTGTKRQRNAGPFLGRRYFVAYGQLRGGARRTAKGEFDTRASNLPPGIWAALGTTGADVRPVLMFTRPGAYRPRFTMENVARAADVQDYLDRRVRFRIREAAGV